MISLSEFCKQTLLVKKFDKWEVLSSAIDRYVKIINKTLAERITEYRKKFGNTLDLQFSENSSYINYFIKLWSKYQYENEKKAPRK